MVRSSLARAVERRYRSRVPATDALLVLLAVGFAAVAQSFSGFGFGLLVVPLLVLLLGPREAVVTSNVLATALGAAMLLQLRHQVWWGTAFRLFFFAALGMPGGYLVLIWIDRDALQLLIACTVLAATWLLARGRWVVGQSVVGDAVAGLLSGVLRTSTSMSGPPVVLYLQGRGLLPLSFRATITAYFFLSGLLAVPLFVAGGQFDARTVTATLVGLPGLAVGWRAGGWLYGRVEEEAFRIVVVAILVASSLSAIGLALA